MKYLLFATMMALSVSAGAQVSLEQSYKNIGLVSVHNIENEGYKYMAIDVTNKKVLLYNTNHSLWKTIAPTLPSGVTMTGAAYPTTLLFDNDSEVEVVVSYADFSPTPIAYTSIIVNENGTIIKTLPDISAVQVVKVDAAYKLIANNFNTPYSSDVYSLPGKHLGLQKPGKGNSDNTDTEFYPNPMQSAATLHYALPSGVHSGVIDVYNTAGAKMRSYQITDQYNDIIIHRGDLPSGVYYYNVTTAEGTSAAQKFVIQ